MAGKRTILKALKALLSKKYKDPKLVESVMKKTREQWKELEKQGKSFTLEVYDINAPSSDKRTFPSKAKDKERER